MLVRKEGQYPEILSNQPTQADIKLAIEVLNYFAPDPTFDEIATGTNIANLEEVMPRYSAGQLMVPGRYNGFSLRRMVDDLLGITARKEKLNSDVEFEATGESLLVGLKHCFTIPAAEEKDKGKRNSNDKYIDIICDLYRDSKGRDRVRLNLLNNFNVYRSGWNGESLERWILRNESTEEVDCRLVVFEQANFQDPKKNSSHYVKIRLSGEKNMFEIQTFKPIRARSH